MGVHSNKSHASSSNSSSNNSKMTATGNSSTLLSQHCFIKNGQLQRSGSSKTTNDKQSRPRVPTRTSSFLTKLKSTAKRIRSNDSATTTATTSSSWCKTSKTTKPNE